MPSPHNGIKVYLRVRPSKRPSGYLISNDEEPSKLDIQIPSELASTHVNNSKSNYKFNFDGIIGMEANQEDVFDRVAKVSCIIIVI